MTDDEPTDAARLLALINASWISQAIFVAAELGLADRLARGASRAEPLAEPLAVDAGALHRLLRALVTIGICRESEGGAFALTPMGHLLASDGPRSLRAWARWWGGHLWPVWGDLLGSVKTGISARQRSSGREATGMLEDDSAAADLFHRAMGQLTRVEAEQVVRAYPFWGVTTVVDVGGGRGELLGLILEADPNRRGILFDRPHALLKAEQHLQSIGVRDRCDLVAGDFFDRVPRGGDLYILKSIIHDWNDERATCLLECCRQAMGPAARLLVVERLLPERLTTSATDRAIVQSDLHMLIGPGGKERSESELRLLAQRAGLDVRRVLPAGVVSVLEARTSSPPSPRES
ncbi:MAG: methyltransferase [Myxococcota bacterium]